MGSILVSEPKKVGQLRNWWDNSVNIETKVLIFNHVKIENEQQTLDGSSILTNMIAILLEIQRKKYQQTK